MSHIKNDGSRENEKEIKRLDRNEENWDSALNFLKIQNEKTMKFKENWKKEKNSFSLKLQRMKIKLQKYKKENDVLVKRLRSIKIRNLKKDKKKQKFSSEREQKVYRSIRNSDKLLMSKKKNWNSNTTGARNSHPIQPSSTKNIRGVGFLYQNNAKGNFGISRKSDNLAKDEKEDQKKDRRRHIRAKSDIPILTQLMRESKMKGEGLSLGGGFKARMLEKKGLKHGGIYAMRCSGDTPMSARTAGLFRMSLDKDNYRRERLASSLVGSALFSNIKILNNNCKNSDSISKSYADKLKHEMSKTHRRGWNAKYAKLSKIEKSNAKASDNSERLKKKLSTLNLHKSAREDSFLNKNATSLKKLKKGFMFNNESKKTVKASEEYDLDFRAKSQRDYKKYDKSMTDLMPSVKSIKLGEKVVKVNKVLNHHLDSVRDTAFFDQSMMISCSDDYTVCLWDVSRSSKNRQGLSPSCVSRIDSHIILKLETNRSKYSAKKTIFSSNSNGEVRAWTLNTSKSGSTRDSNMILEPTMVIAERADAIWDMATTSSNNLLLTSSLEGISVWDLAEFNNRNYPKSMDTNFRNYPYDPESGYYRPERSPSIAAEAKIVKKVDCVQEFKYDPNSLFFIKKSTKGKYGRVSNFIDRKKNYDIPTSLTWVDKSIFACGFSNSNHVVLFDIEKAKNKKLLSMKINKMSKLKAFTNKQGYLSQPNKIILENENMLFVGYENKFVACFDRRTGKTVKEFIAHTDSVTSLQYSPKSSILFTSSHDGCLRSWDIRTFRCVNDMSIHRKKFDESILSLELNSDRSKLASAGADGYVKIMNLVK